jgi:hypothetical protein
LERALDQLEAGDVLVVTKLDRLARSTLDLLRIIDLIGKEGAGFKSLSDPWADTTSAHGRLMLTVLSGTAKSAGASTVAKYMARRRQPPSQGWKTFLCNHADGIASMDLFVVPTISFRLLYGFVAFPPQASVAGCDRTPEGAAQGRADPAYRPDRRSHAGDASSGWTYFRG